MRFRTVLGEVIAILALMTVSFAAVPTIIPHQGRLLKTDGTPESGTKSLTFRLYDTPTGGMPLASETQLVTVTNGLYSVQLSAFGDNALYDHPQCYMGIQVESDAELVPRMLIGSVPHARLSSGVDGDVKTSEGKMTITALSDPDYLNEMVLHSNGSGTGVEMLDSSKIDHSSVRATWTTSNPGIGTVSGGALSMEVDDDGDGVPESEMLQSITPTTCGVAINTKGTGADKGRTINIGCDDSGSVITLLDSSTTTGARAKGTIKGGSSGTGGGGFMSMDFDVDDDGDGFSESKANIAAQLNGNVVIGCLTDTDDDGIPDYTNELSTSPSGASHSIGWNTIADLGANDNKQVTLRVTPIDASGELLSDSDGDGVMEKNIGLYVSEVSGKSEMRSSIDSDDDGVSNSDASLSCDSAGGELIVSSTLSNGDVSTVSIQGNKAMPRTEVVKKIWATGHSNGVITTASDSPDGIVGEIAIEEEGNRRVTLNGSAAGSALGFLAGVAIPKFINITAQAQSAAEKADVGMLMGTGSDTAIVIESNAASSSTRLSSRSGSTTGTIRMLATPDSADQSSTVGDGSSSSSSSMRTRINELESKLQSIGLLARSSASSTTTPSSAVSLHAADLDSDGNPDCRVTVQARDQFGNAEASMYLDEDSDDDGVTDISAEMVVNSDSASLRLNGLPPGVPVIGGISMTATPTGSHMEVGDATCDGTNWVNASDVNSKENFEVIDGQDILDKISELEITRWNYKGKADIEHIGPTAQDFKAAFGVGANDKTISTIDPSGIALAAIKELNKQNQQLAKQNNELKKELEDLKKKVDELSTKR